MTNIRDSAITSMNAIKRPQCLYSDSDLIFTVLLEIPDIFEVDLGWEIEFG